MSTFKIGDEVEVADSRAKEHLIKLGLPTSGVVAGIAFGVISVNTIYGICFNPDVLKLVSKEKDTFSSQQEIWEYLISGGTIKSRRGEMFRFIEGKINKVMPDGRTMPYTTPFIDHSQYSKYKEPVQTNWYDNIPEQGVLCWVSDCNSNPRKGCKIDTIDSYNQASIHPYLHHLGHSRYTFATPVTQDEVNELIYKPTV